VRDDAGEARGMPAAAGLRAVMGCGFKQVRLMIHALIVPVSGLRVGLVAGAVVALMTVADAWLRDPQRWWMSRAMAQARQPSFWRGSGDPGFLSIR
jgi:hypothetical protein